jgi:hypothetical protein
MEHGVEVYYLEYKFIPAASMLLRRSKWGSWSAATSLLQSLFSRWSATYSNSGIFRSIVPRISTIRKNVKSSICETLKIHHYYYSEGILTNIMLIFVCFKCSSLVILCNDIHEYAITELAISWGSEYTYGVIHQNAWLGEVFVRYVLSSWT